MDEQDLLETSGAENGGLLEGSNQCHDIPMSMLDFDNLQQSNVIEEDNEPKTMDPHDELLRWHYRLGHLLFERICKLAKRGELPQRLLKAKVPFCAACQYGKMI